MSKLIIVVWQPLAKTEVLVLWILKDPKMLTNAYAPQASLANIVNPTLTIVLSILVKTEAPVSILSTITNAIVYLDLTERIAKLTLTNVALTLALTGAPATTPLTISFAPAHLDLVAKTALLKLTSVPEIPVCITVFVLTN